MIVSARTFGLALLLALLVGPAEGAEAPTARLGPAGGLLLNPPPPPCLMQDFATAYERCVPPRPATDATTDARTKAVIERVVVLIYLRRWDEARQELDAEIAASPTAVELRHLAARMAVTSYRERYQPSWLEAAQTYSAAAVAMAPGDADVRATEAFILAVKGHTEDAIAAYGVAIALRSDHAFALGQRALLHAAKGRHLLALKDYDAAVASAPGDRALRYGRAKLLIDLERPGAALEELNVFIEQNPNSSLAYVLRAGVHRRLGNSEAALEDLTTLIFGPKGGPPFIAGGDQLTGYLMQRALVLSDLNRHTEAADDMLRAVNLGGKQHILRLQVYLRQRGHISLPLDGAPSDDLTAAVESCFREAICRRGLAQRS